MERVRNGTPRCDRAFMKIIRAYSNVLGVKDLDAHSMSRFMPQDMTAYTSISDIKVNAHSTVSYKILFSPKLGFLYMIGQHLMSPD